MIAKASLVNAVPARAERGLNFLVVQRRIVYRDAHADWPVLYLFSSTRGAVPLSRPYEPLLDFFADYSSRSNEWRRRVAIAMGLHVDYCAALFEKQQLTRDAAVPTLLLKGFARALVEGTIEIENGRKVDKIGLYWPPRSKDRAARYLASLSDFYGFLEREGISKFWNVSDLLEKASQDPDVMARLVAAAQQRAKKSLLAHISASVGMPRHFAHGIIGKVRIDALAARAFPKQYWEEFLTECFVNGSEPDYNAELIAHILFLGGPRTSELFHLFVSDVRLSEDTPLIFLHHPTEGKVEISGSGTLTTRAHFLQEIGRVPRTYGTGCFHAGWKGALDDLQGTPIYLLPLTDWQRRLSRLLAHYLTVYRPHIMEQRPAHVRDHPYLFVSLGTTSGFGGVAKGEPYTLSAFRAAWKRAFRKLQKAHPSEDLRYGKQFGTTPHGARHFYGSFATSLGLPGLTIREMMHHRSLESHHIYDRPTAGEINQMLTERGKHHG